MKFDFNSITVENETAVQAKFRTAGKGINMGKYAASPGVGQIAKWEDLVNPTMYSITDIKMKMLDMGNRILNTVQDDLLGTTTTAFTHINERDEVIEFSWIECYTFLRSVLRYRMETEEYKQRKREREELQKYIDENKSKSQKLKEAKSRLKELDSTL